MGCWASKPCCGGCQDANCQCKCNCCKNRARNLRRPLNKTVFQPAGPPPPVPQQKQLQMAQIQQMQQMQRQQQQQLQLQQFAANPPQPARQLKPGEPPPRPPRPHNDHLGLLPPIRPPPASRPVPPRLRPIRPAPPVPPAPPRQPYNPTVEDVEDEGTPVNDAPTTKPLEEMKFRGMDDGQAQSWSQAARPQDLKDDRVIDGPRNAQVTNDKQYDVKARKKGMPRVATSQQQPQVQDGPRPVETQRREHPQQVRSELGVDGAGDGERKSQRQTRPLPQQRPQDAEDVREGPFSSVYIKQPQSDRNSNRKTQVYGPPASYSQHRSKQWSDTLQHLNGDVPPSGNNQRQQGRSRDTPRSRVVRSRYAPPQPQQQQQPQQQPQQQQPQRQLGPEDGDAKHRTTYDPLNFVGQYNDDPDDRQEADANLQTEANQHLETITDQPEDQGQDPAQDQRRGRRADGEGHRSRRRGEGKEEKLRGQMPRSRSRSRSRSEARPRPQELDHVPFPLGENEGSTETLVATEPDTSKSGREKRRNRRKAAVEEEQGAYNVEPKNYDDEPQINGNEEVAEDTMVEEAPGDPEKELTRPKTAKKKNKHKGSGKAPTEEGEEAAEGEKKKHRRHRHKEEKSTESRRKKEKKDRQVDEEDFA